MRNRPPPFLSLAGLIIAQKFVSLEIRMLLLNYSFSEEVLGFRMRKKGPGTVGFRSCFDKAGAVLILWERFPEVPALVLGGFEWPDFSGEELSWDKHSFHELVYPADVEGVWRERIIFSRNGGQKVVFRYRLGKDPAPHWIEEEIVYLEEERRYLSFIVDITYWKRREAELLEQLEVYYHLFEQAPISLWEEDFSALKECVDRIKEQGVTDFESYLDAHPEEVASAASRVRVINVNLKTLEIYGADSKKQFFESLSRLTYPYSFQKFKAYLLAIAQGKLSFEWEELHQNLRGQPIWVRFAWQVVPGHEHDFSRVIGILEDISQKKVLEAEMFYRAEHDSLTGLLNRNALLERMEKLFADRRFRNRKLAIFFIDLDNFKAINDFFGHQVGDEVLKAFAKKLRGFLRTGDLLARFGGDEFVLVLKDINYIKDMSRVKTFLENLCGKFWQVGGRQVRLFFSVGVAFYPEDATDFEEL
ncbi:MAG: sensor domain-containing diguanylate cyclase, partial [Candidatus Atribacteria bacterium]|nr:sensor domain-containing diguanylate cyclase [Candidatus Atribacteria bacterium]MCD6350430.1 sensor domain-containing diguanylate cyclase [Candidatus Atribacteria bacterium]